MGTPAASPAPRAVGTPHLCTLLHHLSLTCQSSCFSPVEKRQTPKVKGMGEAGCVGLRLQCSQHEQTSQPTEQGGAMGEATLPSKATMLQSRARVRVMAGLSTGWWLALDIRLYRDNTERGFTCFERFSFSFPGLRSGGEVSLLGYSVCACVRARVFVCFSFHRDTKSTACRRGRERRSSRSHEVFWIKRLKPAHFSSLSLMTVMFFIWLPV